MRAYALLVILFQWTICGFTPLIASDVPDPSKAEENGLDAYMVGPKIYEELRMQIREMDTAALIGVLMENDRRVIAARPDWAGDPGSLTIEKKMPDGSFLPVATILPPILEKPRLLPHEIYNRAGLEMAIKEVIDGHINGPVGPDVAGTLADIFIEGPDEAANVATALRTGRIKHGYGNTLALDWMLKVGRFSKDYTVAGTTAAWLLDPAFRSLRAKEFRPGLPRQEEIAMGNQFIALLQGQKNVKRRDLLYCLLKGNRNHQDKERLEDLQFITLSRMAEWDDNYPEKEFERVSDQLGFFRRLTVAFRYRDDETPVLAVDLSTEEIDFDQCPFLSIRSFR